MTPAAVLSREARWALVHGDCLEALAELPEASVDAVVTDPPYGIRFMGKAWDGADIQRQFNRDESNHKWRKPGSGRTGRPSSGSPAAAAGTYNLAPRAMRAFQEFSCAWAAHCLRALKPGGHLLAFASSRTVHRMVSGVEDAGFEIRDTLMWLYGSGFPKSLNIGGGRGTALKPAHEPIVLARKPLEGTVAANVQAHGTGALNVDGCRIGTAADMNPRDFDDSRRTSPKFSGVLNGGKVGEYRAGTGEVPSGRWPANVVLDEEAARLLDAQSGTSGEKLRVEKVSKSLSGYGGGGSEFTGIRGHGDSGGASRFFYTAKADRSERDGGLELLEPHGGGKATGRKEGSAGLQSPRAGAGRTGGARNTHPTVKPLSLMRWLCRLVTPPGGVVLDPFAGSGTTGLAALREGFRFVGMEQEAAYVTIARERLSAWAEVQESLSTLEARAAGQLALFAGRQG